MSLSYLYYWLSLGGVTDKRLNALLDVMTPADVWDDVGKSGKLRKFLGDRASDILIRYRDRAFLEKSIEKLTLCGIKIVTLEDADYPKQLKQPEVCPPPVLYYKGDLSVATKPCVAIVGTRACSRYGREVAESIARELAEAGITVVSGLATGIDGYAHAECLRAKGKTVAVLGSGLNYIYPAAHTSLAQDIEYNGALITQYSPDFAPTRYSFPERNRLISGLCKAIIVVEASQKSGSLITAEYAVEQNREVFAVPGNITSSKSVGANKLIKDGASIFTGVDDVLQELGLKATKNQDSHVLMLDFYEQKIYNLLQEGEKTFDEIVEISQLKPSQVNSTLTGMEIKGWVIRRNDGYGIK